ncbi:MAG: hypothetical protein methR_P0757 [Methyloprofundus sp.]|nr:MAG: hypothetical protein methR_P0757 [Methyloprofundus sp.]
MEKNIRVDSTQATACILCSINCGITVDLNDGQLTKIKGDSRNPKSEGYLCQKATRLNYYQNHSARLTNPLYKTKEGNFAKISWDKATNEVAEKLKGIRKDYGDHAIAYYGGGGQGNHLCQIYSSAFRAALGISYLYTAFAQEKTGDFWVNGKLFGQQSCHITEDIEHADYVLFIGTNPFQSHGFPQTRKVLGQIAQDPNKTMVVIDPRITETAKKADFHLQIKPGMDAFLLSAMVGIIIQESLEDNLFIKEHTTGFDEIRKIFKAIPVKEYVAKAGLDSDSVQKITRDFAHSKRACIRVDLGLQQSIHSTLNSYLEKLLFLITGNFGKEGANNLHTQFVPIIGHSKSPEEGGIVSKVTGMREISHFFPPNILPLEIDADHPDRIRALIVDSSNPILTAADSQAYEQAFKKLDLLVVIDVAETETATMAHYVLPASSQFEKWEASFFTLDFPVNYFQLRKPIVNPTGNTLSEPEIYRRIMVAMGVFPRTNTILQWIAKLHFQFPSFAIFPIALQVYLALFPNYKKSIAMVLYASLGKAMKNGAQNAAVLWGISYLYAKKYRKAVLRTGIKGKGLLLGDALFKRILECPSGIELSIHHYEEVWDLVETPDKKIRLYIAEMIADIQQLVKEENSHQGFPFILAAGERRAYNANQIFRDPNWRKKDREGVLRIHTDDALKIGVENGGSILCQSAKHAIEVKVELDNAMRLGFVALPHGYGFDYSDDSSKNIKQNGPKINLLTSSHHCDPLTKTPHHKYVPVKLIPVKRQRSVN